jgi:hypothetical protein
MVYANVAAGDVINASTINDLIRFALNKPVGRLRQGTAQTGIVNSTTTAVTFAAGDEIDTDNFHDIATNNTRVTPTVAGVYRVTGAVSIAGNTDYTQVQCFFQKNGTALAPAHRITPSATSNTLVLPVSAEIQCNGTTDYFEIAFNLSRSGAGTAGTAVSSQFASVLEWAWDRTEP